ncbi:unnamed protein product, partial [Symbiodinium microadriaticum]
DGSDNWPLVVLYPQYSQIDVIQGTDPSTMLVLLLAEMFPEPENSAISRNVQWDLSGEYHVSNLAVYVQIHSTVPFASKEEWMEYNRSREGANGEESDVECAIMQYDNKQRGDNAQLLEIHMGCTIQHILAVEGMVVEGGLLSILVFPKNCSALKKFLEHYHLKMGVPTLTPDGIVTKI